MAEHLNDCGIPHNPHIIQDVLNQSWPEPDVAERIKDHASIDVTVRLEFARDGEAWLDGTSLLGASSSCRNLVTDTHCATSSALHKDFETAVPSGRLRVASWDRAVAMAGAGVIEVC